MRGNNAALHETQDDIIFQFTPLHERQLPGKSSERVQNDFNSRLYMRGNALDKKKSELSSISIHASTWEATCWFLSCPFTHIISIHASTWEATPHDHMSRRYRTISIHASTWEATYTGFRYIQASGYFNSRLYMRGNLSHDPRGHVSQISIHASTWEATQCFFHLWWKCLLFQFTPLHERQQQKCTIFSIKSTQFSTKPCFFIVTSRKVVFFSIPVQYFL